MILFLLDIFSGMRRAIGIRRIQLKYIFGAFFIMMIIGSPAFLPAYGIDIYPFAYISGAIFAGIVGFAITRYRLMDVRVVLRRVVLHLLISFTFLGIILGAIFIVAYFFAKRIPDYSLVYTGSIAMIFVLLFYEQVKKAFEKVAKKYFFASLYDYQETMEKFASDVTSTINLKEVVYVVVDTIKKTIQVDDIAVLVKNGNYQPMEVLGFNENRLLSIANGPQCQRIINKGLA